VHTIEIALAFEQINRLPDRWPAEVILFLKLALGGDWLMLAPRRHLRSSGAGCQQVDNIWGLYCQGQLCLTYAFSRAIIIVDKMLSGLYQLDYLKYLIESQEPPQSYGLYIG